MQDLLAFCLSAVPFPFSSLPLFPLLILSLTFCLYLPFLLSFFSFFVSTIPFLSLSPSLFYLSLSFTHTHLKHIAACQQSVQDTCAHTNTHLPFAALFFFFFFGVPYVSVFDRTGLEKCDSLMGEMCSPGLSVHVHISQAYLAIVEIYCYIYDCVVGLTLAV